MKLCPACQKTYPDDYQTCPRDQAQLTVLSDEITIGTILRGKYEVLGQLGSGGMATVYKVLHKAFQELAAVKVVHSSIMQDPSFIKRFRNEAIVARQLKHPNAVRIDDFDYTDDGRPFIVMEFVEGKSLYAMRKELSAPWPVDRCINIVSQAASALGAAHTLGIVHRDIKPANIILLLGTDGNLQVKVLDFGIAKVSDNQFAGMTSVMTQQSMIIGTPEYMSPEQAEGLLESSVDGRADLYSLGLVFYEMLTGTHPFQADTPMGMLIQQVHTIPAPPDSFHTPVSPAISALVLKAIRKDPGDRFQTAGEMLAALKDPEAWYKSQYPTTPVSTEAVSSGVFTPVPTPVTPVPTPAPISAAVAVPVVPVAPIPKGKGNTSKSMGIWIGVGFAAVLLAALAVWASHSIFGIMRERLQGSSNDQAAHSSEASAVKPTQQAPAPVNVPIASMPPSPTPAASTSTPAAPAEKSSPAPSGKGAQAPSDKKAQAQAMYSEADKLIGQQQFVKALPLATDACHAGVAAACADLGSMYESGQGVNKDEQEANVLYRQACDGGSGRGCTLLGDQNVRTGPLHTNAAQALGFYRQGCTGGYASGCTKVAWLYEGFVAGAPPADFDQAASFALKGCRGGDTAGCLIAAFVYKWGGHGLTQDKVQAATLFQKGCDAHDFGACGELGTMYENGEGVARDGTRAVALLGEACDHNVGFGCRGLGDLYENGNGVARDYGRAVAYYRKDCDSGQTGSVHGCMALAASYRSGKGVPQDNAQAAAIYRKVCNAGGDVHEACDALKTLTK